MSYSNLGSFLRLTLKWARARQNSFRSRLGRRNRYWSGQTRRYLLAANNHLKRCSAYEKELLKELVKGQTQ